MGLFGLLPRLGRRENRSPRRKAPKVHAGRLLVSSSRFLHISKTNR